MTRPEWDNVTVRWNGRQWVVTCPENGRVASEHDTKEKAVWAGRQCARRLRPSQLTIFRRDGQAEQVFSYRPGRDGLGPGQRRSPNGDLPRRK